MTSIEETLSIRSKKGLVDDIASLAFTQNPIAMLVLDENNTILKTNLALNTLTKYDEIDLLGKHISFFEFIQDESLVDDISYKNTMQSEQDNSCDIYLRCNHNEHILVRQNSKNIMSESKQYTILTFEDMTEQKRILEHYQHLSTHDPLTGLANRVLLHDNFKNAQYRAIRNHQKMALLVCDINEFKQFNDSHGHELGDSVLKLVAKTLKEVLRANDTVARYGGDEFVLILGEIDNINQINQIIAKIKAVFPISCINGDENYKINMSIGSAYFPDEGYSFNELIQIADENMYQEKKSFYSSD